MTEAFFLETHILKFFVPFLLLFSSCANAVYNYHDYPWTRSGEKLTTYASVHSDWLLKNAREMYDRYNAYSPFIRETAKAYEVPPEIVVLAAIESSFSPSAKSKVGAVGMWQFLAPTAREYGLIVDGKIDERLDWQKSTVASVRYLKWLAEEKLNNDYETAIIAYNYGIGNTLKAISRARSSNAWVLINADFVPKESANHLMRFLIYIEIFNHLDSTS